jgi:Fuc2NAc and GlcNAc transferase
VAAFGFIVAIAAGLLSLSVSALICRYAEKLRLVQHPNERSSHVIPTPGGGGIGIVLGGTLGGAFAMWSMPGSAFVVVVLALALGLVGLIDDRRQIPAGARLLVQLLLVAAMVWTLQPVALADVVGLPLAVELSVIVIVLAAVYWVNVFNFMDGIDGLAASQAIFLLAAQCLLAFGGGLPAPSPFLFWILSVGTATFGFLLLNWPPARIFMGDAGSTYLGFMVAFTALSGVALGWFDLLQWLILAALFLADATITLLRRALRGEPVMQAHRLHAYQHLARRWRSHRLVTMLYMGINTLWLLPLAWLAGVHPGSRLIAAVAAYLPIALLLLLGGAGRREVKPSSS